MLIIGFSTGSDSKAVTVAVTVRVMGSLSRQSLQKLTDGQPGCERLYFESTGAQSRVLALAKTIGGLVICWH